MHPESCLSPKKAKSRNQKEEMRGEEAVTEILKHFFQMKGEQSKTFTALSIHWV